MYVAIYYHNAKQSSQEMEKNCAFTIKVLSQAASNFAATIHVTQQDLFFERQSVYKHIALAAHDVLVYMVLDNFGHARSIIMSILAPLSHHLGLPRMAKTNCNYEKIFMEK